MTLPAPAVDPPPPPMPAPPPAIEAPATGLAASAGNGAVAPRLPAVGAPAQSGVAATPADRSAELERFRALLRDLATEARDIGTSIGDLRTALAVTDPDARQHDVAEGLADLARAVAAGSAVVSDRLAELEALLDASTYVYDQFGDVVLTASNLWNRALAELPSAYSLPEHVRFAAAVESASAALTELIWHVAVVTIPPRLNQHLATMSVGGRLDFAATFADELPDPAGQRRLLDYLAAHPLFVAGVVDAENGIIYKSSQNRWRRLASYVLILALAGPVGVALAKVLTDGAPWAGLAPGWAGIAAGRFNELITAYALLLLGSALHIGVEAVKQGQRGSSGSFTVIGDWLAWIHVRELAIAAGIVVVWLTLVGLAVTLGTGALTPQTAIFAGYSIDSVFGLFVTRFDAAATGNLQKLLPGFAGSTATPAKA